MNCGHSNIDQIVVPSVVLLPFKSLNSSMLLYLFIYHLDNNSKMALVNGYKINGSLCMEYQWAQSFYPFNKVATSMAENYLTTLDSLEKVCNSLSKKDRFPMLALLPVTCFWCWLWVCVCLININLSLSLQPAILISVFYPTSALLSYLTSN